MKKKTLFLLLVMVICHTIMKSQTTSYDTTIISNSPYGKFQFTLGSFEMQYFEVMETEIELNDLEIEGYKNTTDTIGLKKISSSLESELYELELSDNTWSEIFFDDRCSYVMNQIEGLPTLKIERKLSNNELTFFEPEIVSAFVKDMYKKGIVCIESTDDKFMSSFYPGQIERIDSKGINHFIPLFTSRLYHLFSLYDLIVPTGFPDTLVCKISTTVEDQQLEVTYQSSTKLNVDSTITVHLTDKIAGAKSNQESFTESIYNMFDEHLSPEEKRINEIRFNSMKSEDQSNIHLSIDRTFEKYVRIMESSILNAELKQTISISNYRIHKLK